MDPHLDHPAMLDLLQHYPSPAVMKTAGTTRMANRLLKLAPRMERRLAEQRTAPRRQRSEIAVVVEKLVEDFFFMHGVIDAGKQVIDGHDGSVLDGRKRNPQRGSVVQLKNSRTSSRPNVHA